MEPATHLRMIEALRAEIAAPANEPPFQIAADRYRNAAWFERERSLFRLPAIAGQRPAPGTCAPVGNAIVASDASGMTRAFANTCRHRGTRLVDVPCAAKALVCPYHGWTYGLDGALLHVPHQEAFAGIGERSLLRVPMAERHGLVWLGGEPVLGGLDADLAALRLDQHVTWKTATVIRKCNWKLVVEAFLDGYHIRVLHRDSIYRFFLDAASVAEPEGDHIRAITGRRALRDGVGGDLRLLATPSFLIFPATVIIVHPDFVSLVSLVPLAPDVTEWRHAMLVPASRAAEAEHWDRSWGLIEETVFQGEDLWVCEQIQRGLAGGEGLGAAQNSELLFGSLEHAIRWFHAAIDRHVG